MTISDEELSKRVSRATFMTRLFVVVASGLLTAILVLNLVLVAVMRHQQVVNTGTATETSENTAKLRALAKTIVSCTDPAGACYKQGQERTGEAVASINQVVIYAVACSKVVPNQGERTFTEIQSCVEQRLRAAHSH